MIKRLQEGPGAGYTVKAKDFRGNGIKFVTGKIGTYRKETKKLQLDNVCFNYGDGTFSVEVHGYDWGTEALEDVPMHEFDIEFGSIVIDLSEYFDAIVPNNDEDSGMSEDEIIENATTLIDFFEMTGVKPVGQESFDFVKNHFAVQELAYLEDLLCQFCLIKDENGEESFMEMSATEAQKESFDIKGFLEFINPEFMEQVKDLQNSVDIDTVCSGGYSFHPVTLVQVEYKDISFSDYTQIGGTYPNDGFNFSMEDFVLYFRSPELSEIILDAHDYEDEDYESSSEEGDEKLSESTLNVYDIAFATDGSNRYAVLPINKSDSLATLRPIDNNGDYIGERERLLVSDLIEFYELSDRKGTTLSFNDGDYLDSQEGFNTGRERMNNKGKGE